MALFFHSSNQLPILARQFFRDLAAQRSSPLQPQQVVVQTSGMGRWLSLSLADEAGICAGLDFVFPNRIINELFNAALPDLPPLPEQEKLTWQIMALLPKLCATEKNFTPVKHYLADDEQGRKLFQLASRLADLFDQYQIYRPDMILAWQAGQDWFNQPTYAPVAKLQRWQQQLWQALELPINRATIWQRFLHNQNTIQSTKHNQQALFIFGVSVIPPFHLRVFQATAQSRDVHFYQLTPCQEYWGFIKNPQEIKQAERHWGKDADQLFMTAVNPLLASQGVLGRDFLNLVLELSTPFAQEETFLPPEENSHLHLVQADLLLLREPEAGQDEWQKSDHSLAFHSCHSPLREVEVLHDQLLRYMAEYDLTPADILVMSPQLADYAPLLRTVFAGQGLIPFSVADLPGTSLQAMIAAFFNLLQLLNSRFKASEVLGLLEQPMVARAFGLGTAEIQTIRGWLPEVGIRWGIDNDMVLQEHGPTTVSWQAGEERLLLGYAMAGEAEQPCNNIFPWPDFPEDEADTLGACLDFLAALRQYQQQINKPRSLPQWQSLLQELLEKFFHARDEYERPWLAIQELLRPDHTPTQEQELSLAVIQNWLQQRYEQTLHARGFLGGGVTCCAMLPMRSIPFRLICLIGMNDGAFPRLDRQVEYDLLQVEKRLGDRSSKDNDRYLFLETLISAQEFLYISYCGQSQTDNTNLPPSLLVTELYDYLRLRFNLSAAAIEELVTHHRLQGFHPAYFQKHGPLSSYDQENYQAAQAGRKTLVTPPSFFTTPLIKPTPEVISLAELITFFRQPIRTLYQRGLGIYLETDTSLLRDHEPFALTPLERYQLNAQLSQDQHPAELAHHLTLIQAQGQLPDGNPGAWLSTILQHQLKKFTLWLQPWRQHPQDPLEVEVKLTTITITGRLNQLYQGQQLLTCPSPLEIKLRKNGQPKIERRQELLPAWLNHLMLCATGTEQTTMLAGLDCAAISFTPLTQDTAKEILHKLINIYLQGMTAPLPFFPKYSLGLVEGEGREQLQAAWLKDKFQGAANPYHLHAQLAENPFAQPEFSSLAETIGRPLYDHLEISG